MLVIRNNRMWACLLLLLCLLIDFHWALAQEPPALKSILSLEPLTVGSDYRLGPEDILFISVWEDERLTLEALIRPDGMISVPLIGEVAAAGKTTSELKDRIVHLLSKFIPDPSVMVSVKQINSYKIYVIGKVIRAGMFAVGQRIDVLQALTLAGGLAPFAAENSIKILHREKGVQRADSFRYGDVKKGKNMNQNIMLYRGDIVVVP